MSDGNSSLPDEGGSRDLDFFKISGGSASQIPQASVGLAGYGSEVWPDSLFEWLVDGSGLQ